MYLREYAGDSGNTGLQRATAGNSATSKPERMLETLATLGCSGRLLATQQHLREDAGDSGNTGLQQTTAGNPATPVICLMIFMLYDSYMKVKPAIDWHIE